MKYLLLAMSLMLVGCGSSTDSSESGAADEMQDDAGSLTEAVQDTIEDAEAVEDAVMEAKEDLDEAVDAVEEAAGD